MSRGWTKGIDEQGMPMEKHRLARALLPWDSRVLLIPRFGRPQRNCEVPW
jgi:hypothetical protein